VPCACGWALLSCVHLYAESALFPRLFCNRRRRKKKWGLLLRSRKKQKSNKKKSMV
jgi:hypothetical protein